MKPSPNSGEGKWRELYQEAIFEEDPRTWSERAGVAEAAIRDRVLELWPADSGDDQDARERLELHSALYFIGLLRSLQAGRNAAG